MHEAQHVAGMEAPIFIMKEIVDDRRKVTFGKIFPFITR